MARLAKVLGKSRRVLHVYGGVILIAVGVGLWNPALGVGSGGVLLLWLGLSWVK